MRPLHVNKWPWLLHDDYTLQSSQNPTTCPYDEPVESSSHRHLQWITLILGAGQCLCSITVAAKINTVLF